ncbi:MAG TPA: hypothetical protein DEP51_06135 [Clostridiales bacterium]|nr:hypothetical protein [Clostridiales bacterium]
MKQTNKLLNISNILNYVFVLMIGFFVVNYFEQYGLLFSTVVVFVSGIANFVIGIINIVKRNKKIGILNIIIAVMFIFDAIMFNIIDDVDEWMYFIVLACIVAPIVLTILNLIFNRKITDLINKKYKKVLFIFGVIIEFIIVIIPIIVNRINLNNIEKLIEELRKEPNKKNIVQSYDYQGTRFYNEYGELLSDNSYQLLTAEDITASNDENNKSYFEMITLLMVNEKNEIWLVDYDGKKISRIYRLFESNEDSFARNYINILNKKGYEKIPYSYLDSEKSIPLTYQNGNIYRFGSVENNGYQILVELNENEIENDLDLYKKMISFNTDLNSADTENSKKLENIYKHKKNYYIIDKEGKQRKLECNNLIFDLNNFRDNIIIRQYYNGYIPYYDNGSSGFFNTEGEKRQLNKNYIVKDTADKYAIIYNIQNDEDYIYLFDNNKFLQINDNEYKELYWGKNEILFYDNNYIVTYTKTYILKDTMIKEISNNNNRITKYKFINLDINPYQKQISPYNYIGITGELLQ